MFRLVSKFLVENGNRIYSDESVMAKRKYHIGHMVTEKWVFGMYDVHQELGVICFVDDRTQGKSAKFASSLVDKANRITILL